MGGLAGRRVHLALQAMAASVCIAPTEVQSHAIKVDQPAMRAETLNIVDEIKQAITLLRRHL
jgi:hypothetical protein